MQLVSTIRAFSGLVTVPIAIIAATGAVWKFFAWWQDRQTKARVESATFFVGNTGAHWHKAFGEQQLIRINFRRLTGIDRKTGHSGLIRLHKQLGGEDSDWKSLKYAGPYVRTRGTAAYVRRLYPRDFTDYTFGLFGIAVFGVTVVTLLYLTVYFGTKTLGVGGGLRDLILFLSGIFYILFFTFLAVVMFFIVRRVSTAEKLRLRLLSSRRKNRQ